MANQHPIDLIIKQINELDNKISKILNGFGLYPIPGSIAAIELAPTETAETVLSAYSYGTLLIEVSSNNLSAFIREITEPALQYALCTNIRNILEAASISIWLLDEHIDLNERIFRSYSFRYKGLEQMRKWAYSANNLAEIEHAENRKNQILQKAKERGIITDDEKGKTILAHKMPNFTDMVIGKLNQEKEYRLLSSGTHANYWALLALGFTIIAEIPYGKLIENKLDLKTVLYIAQIGLNAFQKQIMCKCRLFGYSTADVEAAFADTTKLLSQYS